MIRRRKIGKNTYKIKLVDLRTCRPQSLRFRAKIRIKKLLEKLGFFLLKRTVRTRMHLSLKRTRKKMRKKKKKVQSPTVEMVVKQTRTTGSKP